MAELGAGEGLHHLVHAGVVATPVVRALITLAREVRIVTRHFFRFKQRRLYQIVFVFTVSVCRAFSPFLLTFLWMSEACHSASNRSPSAGAPQSDGEGKWFGLACLDLAG